MPEDLITLPGRVLLPDGTESDCTIRCGEPETMRIAPALTVQGARLVCRVPGLGVVEGVAGCPTVSGQDFLIRGTPSHLARLAARIGWHRRRAAGQEDQRGHDRIVPMVTDVRVRGAAGEEMPGTLLDLSSTGAAMRLQVRLEVGTSVVVGLRRATVVRHLDDGVAVRFALPLRPEDVTVDTVL